MKSLSPSKEKSPPVHEGQNLSLYDGWVGDFADIGFTPVKKFDDRNRVNPPLLQVDFVICSDISYRPENPRCVNNYKRFKRFDFFETGVITDLLPGVL